MNSLRGGRKKGRGRGEGEKRKSREIPSFSLPSYPLPHSKPATQATHENRSYSLFESTSQEAPEGISGRVRRENCQSKKT